MKSSPMPSTSQLPASPKSPLWTIVREDRALRIGQHHFGSGRHFREVARKPRDGAARAHASNYGIDLLPHLRPDFWAGRALVGGGIVRIVELIRVKGARLLGDAHRQILIVIWVPLRNVRAGKHNLRAKGAQVGDLLAAHLVGNDERQLVAAPDRHERQGEAGISRRCLDDAPARL